MFLNLFKMKFPPMAIISILHRISGVAIFLSLPFWLYFLSESLQGPLQFAKAQQSLASHWGVFIVFVSLLAVIYHLIAGVRHLLMDFGYGETLPTARYTAYLVLGLTGVFAVLLGVWLW